MGWLITYSEDLANVAQLWGGPSLLSSPVRAPDVRLPDHLKILSYGFVLFFFSFLKLKPILITNPYAHPCDHVALMPGT